MAVLVYMASKTCIPKLFWMRAIRQEGETQFLVNVNAVAWRVVAGAGSINTRAGLVVTGMMMMVSGCSGRKRWVRDKAAGGCECEYAGEEFVFHTW